jgi:acyl-CoA hydrolase
MPYGVGRCPQCRRRSDGRAALESHGDKVPVDAALEVDLLGQVCAETPGPQHYSGVGGQADLVVLCLFTQIRMLDSLILK